MKTAEDICTAAAVLVGGTRNDTHGDKLVNMRNIANVWNAILVAKTERGDGPGIAIAHLTALDVANMLEALKIARRYSGAHNLDDYVDGAGYAGVAGEIAERL